MLFRRFTSVKTFHRPTLMWFWPRLGVSDTQPSAGRTESIPSCSAGGSVSLSCQLPSSGPTVVRENVQEVPEGPELHFTYVTAPVALLSTPMCTKCYLKKKWCNRVSTIDVSKLDIKCLSIWSSKKAFRKKWFQFCAAPSHKLWPAAPHKQDLHTSAAKCGTRAAGQRSHAVLTVFTNSF